MLFRWYRVGGYCEEILEDEDQNDEDDDNNNNNNNSYDDGEYNNSNNNSIVISLHPDDQGRYGSDHTYYVERYTFKSLTNWV